MWANKTSESLWNCDYAIISFHSLSISLFLSLHLFGMYLFIFSLIVLLASSFYFFMVLCVYVRPSSSTSSSSYWINCFSLFIYSFFFVVCLFVCLSCLACRWCVLYKQNECHLHNKRECKWKLEGIETIEYNDMKGQTEYRISEWRN